MGLAGLSAAFRLTQDKWNVTLVEAHPRLGGRVLSHRFAKAPQLVCELGGEWIGTGFLDWQGSTQYFRSWKMVLLKKSTKGI
jgi:monoamine oxidase